MPERVVLLHSGITCLAILLQRAGGSSCRYFRIFLKMVNKKIIIKLKDGRRRKHQTNYLSHYLKESQ